MKLKKEDVILSVENQAVESKKQIYQMLSPILKKKKELSIVVKRESKELLLFYRILPYKKKKQLILSKIEKRKPEQISAKLSPDKKPEIKKRTLIPEKYKPYMQRAYVSSLNSFVYKKPDFDSIKLYPLSIGKKILISKKIFRPPHNFGTFYKVFLFKEKKVVGYISEAEVISEFKRKKGVFVSNPSYKTAKQYISENKVLSLDSIEEIKKSAEKPKAEKPRDTSHKKKYVGLSAGLMTSHIGPDIPREDWFIGLKLSGYNLLISYLNMDINFTSSYSWRHFYLDILTAYPVLKSPHYHLFAMGGLMGSLHLNEDYIMNQNSIDYGLAGAVSLLVPLNKNIALRLDAKAIYEIRKRSIPFGGSASLQVAF